MSKINKDIVSFLLKAAIYTGGNQQIQGRTIFKHNSRKFYKQVENQIFQMPDISTNTQQPSSSKKRASQSSSKNWKK